MNSSKMFIQKDDAGFYYYDNKPSDVRHVYFRAKDIYLLAGASPAALNRNFLDVVEATIILSSKDLVELVLYINQKFADAEKGYFIVPSDLADADENWSSLV